jgi:hypothetical protein
VRRVDESPLLEELVANGPKKAAKAARRLLVGLPVAAS